MTVMETPFLIQISLIELPEIPVIDAEVVAIPSVGVSETSAAPPGAVPSDKFSRIENFRTEMSQAGVFWPEIPRPEVARIEFPQIEIPPEISWSEVPSASALPCLPSVHAFGTPNPPSLEGDAVEFMPRLAAWEEGGRTKRIIFGGGSVQPVDPRRYGELAWPVKGKVSSGFGLRGNGGRARMHVGIDIPVEQGTPIQAAMAGVVAESRAYNGYGNTIILSHDNGMQTLYAHCSELLVKPGEPVEPGQVIAYAGKTGRATVSHVHFGVIVSGTFRDPMALLKGREDRFARRKADGSDL
ncbi:MAG: M23 family metallopeptidase [Synergistaceae bacterium]|nr:M23 family metallopeptidase [Synergistaceae bacterium]